jgi:3-hydroxyisobutyrate dehydrogenase-like beta-hydroxyacid dehydrogenase
LLRDVSPTVSGDYAISESLLKISVEATERLVQTAQAAQINTEFPTFAAGLFKRAMAAGYGNEEAAALIKVLR